MQKKHPPKIPSHNGRTRQPHPARHPLHRHLEQIHLPQILHLTQNTLSDYQNNGAIGSGIGKIALWHNFCVAI